VASVPPAHEGKAGEAEHGADLPAQSVIAECSSGQPPREVCSNPLENVGRLDKGQLGLAWRLVNQ